MKKLILISFLLIASQSFSGVIKDNNDDSEFVIQCLASFIQNPVVKQTYPTFWKQLGMLENQAIDYCQCAEKSLAYELSLAKSGSFDYFFRNKQQEWLKKDNCAVKTIGREWTGIFYASRLYAYLLPYVTIKIDEIVPSASIRKIASEEKYYNYQQCLVHETTKDCGKIKSLGVTYQCIQDNLGMDTFYKNNRNCIHLLEETAKPSIPEEYMRDENNHFTI